jgi:CDP-glycerol glycerophosphotransferase
MPRISVIVPARNVIGYIQPLLADLRRQTFTDFEAIIIDDGSRDGTKERVARFVAEDERFRILEADGVGPSAARNLGLDQASGDLISFVDADDRVAPEYLERLHGALVEHGTDMAVCNARRLEGFRTRASGLHLKACAHPRPATHLGRSPELVYDTTIWYKLIRRRLWTQDNLAFEEGRWINDVYPSLRSHVLARQVTVVGDVL